jgi:type IV secretory pathway TraG/TraD family ATPase VirD4
MGLAALLSVTQKLTEYGQAKFQTRAEMTRNGLLQPLGSGRVFGKLGRPASRAPFISAAFTTFPHCLVVAPTRAGKGVGYVIPNTLLFPGSAVILDVKGEIFEATSRYRQAQGDRIFRLIRRRSLSRRMEERPLLSADEARKLDKDLAILVPERQNPLMVRRVVYFEDPVFKAIYEGQRRSLP